MTTDAADVRVDDPVEHFRALLDELQRRAMACKVGLVQLNDHLRQQPPMPLTRQVDVGFFLREIENLLDDLKKDFAARRKLVGENIARVQTEKLLSDPGTDITVRGEYASGTPDVSTRYRLPKKGDANYEPMLKALGVDPALIEAGVFKLSFDELSIFAAQRESEGRGFVPKDVGRFTEFTTTFRKRSKK